MAEPTRFQQTQLAFTAHLRDPEHQPAPDQIEDRRMAIYRDLLFNNVNSFLENGFPVLRSLYAEADWKQLARQFFARHRSHSPYFVDISREFLDFLENEFEPSDADPAFIQSLAHYEWVELAMMTSQDELSMDGIDRNGDLLSGIPVLSPLAECLAYEWPVHTISEDFQPETPLEQPQYLIVYRHADSDEVGFMEANPVTARLFELIRDNDNLTGQQALEQISEELQHPNPELVIQGGHQILLKLHHAYVIPGVRA